MAKQRDKIAQWKYTSEHLSTRSKSIWQSYCLWLSLLITMPQMLAPVISHSNSIMAITPEFYLKKTSTSAQNLALLTN